MRMLRWWQGRGCFQLRVQARIERCWKPLHCSQISWWRPLDWATGKLEWRGMVLLRSRRRSVDVCACCCPALAGIQTRMGTGRWPQDPLSLEPDAGALGWPAKIPVRCRWRTRWRRGVFWWPGRRLRRGRLPRGGGGGGGRGRAFCFQPRTPLDYSSREAGGDAVGDGPLKPKIPSGGRQTAEV